MDNKVNKTGKPAKVVVDDKGDKETNQPSSKDEPSLAIGGAGDAPKIAPSLVPLRHLLGDDNNAPGMPPSPRDDNDRAPEIVPPIPRYDNDALKLLLGLTDEIDESLLYEKDFSWEDFAKEYKASKYNQKAIRRMSSGNSEEAVALWERAASGGNSNALFNLGICYETGNGVVKDDKVAHRYYSQAVDLDNERAAHNLGEMSLRGHSGNPADEDEAMTHFLRASNLGHVGSYTTLGVLYAERGDMVQAADWFTKAAKESDGIGTLLLGHTYYHGDGKNKDKKKARRLYKTAFRIMLKEKKDSTVKLYLGRCYEQGWGVEQDKEQARHYYKTSDHTDSSARLEFLSSTCSDEGHLTSSSSSQESSSSSSSSDRQKNDNFLDNGDHMFGFRPTFSSGNVTNAPAATKKVSRKMKRVLNPQDDHFFGSRPVVSLGNASASATTTKNMKTEHDQEVPGGGGDGTVNLSTGVWDDEDRTDMGHKLEVEKPTFKLYRQISTSTSSHSGSSDEPLNSWESDSFDTSEIDLKKPKTK